MLVIISIWFLIGIRKIVDIIDDKIWYSRYGNLTLEEYLDKTGVNKKDKRKKT